MTSDELMAKLGALFPASFSSAAAAAAWSEVASTALASYTGPTLQRAYDRVLADWKHGYAPKPADFAVACQEIRAQLHRPRPTTSGQYQSAADRANHIRGEKNRLVDRWIADNVHWLDDWIGANFDAADRGIARGHLLRMLEPKAMAVAQGSKRPVEIIPSELETIKGRVASQRREGAAVAIPRQLSPYLRDGAEPAREIIEEVL